jgi:hypothetical protein
MFETSKLMQEWRTCGYIKQLPNTWAVGRIYIYMKNLGEQIRKSASQKNVNVVDMGKYA